MMPQQTSTINLHQHEVFCVVVIFCGLGFNASRIGDGTKKLVRQDKDDAQLKSEWMLHREASYDDSPHAAIKNDVMWTNPSTAFMTASDQLHYVTTSDDKSDNNVKIKNLDEVDETDVGSVDEELSCTTVGWTFECDSCCEFSSCTKPFKHHWFSFCIPQPTGRPTSSPTSRPIFTMTHHEVHKFGGRRPRPSSMVVAAPVFTADE